jgi:hypothetical protein
MSTLERLITATILISFVYVVLFFNFIDHSNMVIYDCENIEYYHNVPSEVKKECNSLKKSAPPLII